MLAWNLMATGQNRNLSVILILSVLGAWSEPVSAQPCSGPPTAPLALQGRLGGAILTLTWNAPAQGDPARYRIQAGTAPGRIDVANVVTQTTATRFVVPLTRGIYYVRVRAVNPCGVGPASNQIRIVRASGAAPGIPNPKVPATTRTVIADFFGDIMIIGEVQNAWRAGMATFVRINADFFGAGNRFLGTDFTFVDGRSRRLSRSRIITDTTLAGGETGCFVMFTDIPRSQVQRVQTTTSFDAGPAVPLRGQIRLLGDLLLEPDFFGDLKVSGRLRNAGSVLTYFNKIHLDVRNAAGRVLDCDFTFVNGSSVRLRSGITTDTALRPGATGSFKTFSRPPFDQVAAVSQWRTWDEDESPAILATLQSSVDPHARVLALEYEELRSQMQSLLDSAPGGSVTQKERVRLRNQIAEQAQHIETYLAGQ